MENEPINVHDTVEVTECDQKTPHEFTIGRHYVVDEVVGDMYMLQDFDPHTGIEFHQGVFRNEIKLIKRGQ